MLALLILLYILSANGILVIPPVCFAIVWGILAAEAAFIIIGTVAAVKRR